MSHTKTPWGWQKFGNDWYLVGQHTMRPIVLGLMRKPGGKATLTSLVDGLLVPFDPKHPDAAHIVRCVNSHEALTHALGPFRSCGEWGKWVAWLVEGAPTREEGIAAAKIIVSFQDAADAALAAAQEVS